MYENLKYWLESQCSKRSIQPIYEYQIRVRGQTKKFYSKYPLQLIREPMAPDSRQL